MPPQTLRKSVIVNAAITEVWQAWTTEVGVVTFLAPQAKIELRMGGAYEAIFVPDAPPGLRGSEGCQVLEFSAPERLVFTWNFPPSLPELRHAGARTRVTITLHEASAGQTTVTLTQSGWQQGAAWEQGYAYFKQAWAVVLARLQRRFAAGPIDWSNIDD